MDLHTALEILGLSSNPSLADAKKAYREQVKLWHPDRYSNGSALKTIAAKNIQDANLAFAFLKRRLPLTPERISPPPRTKPSREEKAVSAAPTVADLFDRTIRMLAILCRHFPKIPFRSLREWLQHDARNHYRPWYRYPTSPGAEERRRESISFDQALQKAIRHHARPQPTHRRHPPLPHNEPENAIGPISGVSKSGKARRP
jgi:curved DNA-binding protein CbpA